MQVVEDKNLKPGQCHVAGCCNTSRASTKKVGKKSARGKHRFCGTHMGIGKMLPRKTLRSMTATQVVQLH